MWQAGGGVSRARRRRGGQGGGGERGRHVAPPHAVPSAQRGGGKGRGIQGHAADPALDLLRPQLCALLLLLDKPGSRRRGGGGEEIREEDLGEVGRIEKSRGE